MRRAARLLPSPLRRPAASIWSRWRGLGVERDLARLIEGDGPIVAGPWLGEVGFELLYWRPFLAWVVEAFAIRPERMTVVSRGGTGGWYAGLAGRYVDAFEFLDPEAFRRLNEARVAELGEQKQVRVTEPERTMVARVAATRGLPSPALLHPSFMYRAFAPFWWGHADEAYLRRYARFAPLPAPPEDSRPAGLPARYVAAKFYHNDSFPPTPSNREAAARILAALAEAGPVVSLATGLRLDDHAGLDEEARHAQHGMGPARADTNLAVQTAIVAGASRWVGTYGGFAYLAPFLRVPAESYFSNPGGFSPRHLQLAQSVFGTLGVDLLQVRDMATAGAGA